MSIIYYLILFSWIGGNWFFKKSSGFTFMIGFYLFLIAATLTVLGLRDFAEPVMRTSFIGFIIGVIQALIEYKKANN